MFSKFLDFVKEEKHYDFNSSEQFLKSMPLNAISCAPANLIIPVSVYEI